jgi:hypothetical protein
MVPLLPAWRAHALREGGQIFHLTPVSRAEGLGTAAEFVGTNIIDGVFRHCGGAVIVASEQEDAMYVMG